jgi:hypothetical protein
VRSCFKKNKKKIRVRNHFRYRKTLRWQHFRIDWKDECLNQRENKAPSRREREQKGAGLGVTKTCLKNRKVTMAGGSLVAYHIKGITGERQKRLGCK